jgi:hypothetical protein
VIKLAVRERIDADGWNIWAKRSYLLRPLGHAASGWMTTREKLPNLFFLLLAHRM